MIDIKKGFYGLLAGLIIIMIAVDIIVLSRGLMPFHGVVAVDAVIIGALILLNAVMQKEKGERLFYSVWGIFFIVVAGSIAAWAATGDGLVGFAVFLAGIGGIVLYATFLGK